MVNILANISSIVNQLPILIEVSVHIQSITHLNSSKNGVIMNALNNTKFKYPYFVVRKLPETDTRGTIL